jgi:hypothetical protein
MTLPSIFGDLLPRRGNHISPRPRYLPTIASHTLKPTTGTFGFTDRHNPPTHLSTKSGTATPYTLRHRTRRVHLLQPAPFRSQPDKTHSSP